MKCLAASSRHSIAALICMSAKCARSWATATPIRKTTSRRCEGPVIFLRRRVQRRKTQRDEKLVFKDISVVLGSVSIGFNACDSSYSGLAADAADFRCGSAATEAPGGCRRGLCERKHRTAAFLSAEPA